MKKEDSIFLIGFLLVLFVIFVALSNGNKDGENKDIPPPLSEVRCSDLERLYDECETSTNIERCRGRYNLKIAMCYGVR